MASQESGQPECVKAWLADRDAERNRAEEHQHALQELQAAKDRIAELEAKLEAERNARNGIAHLSQVQSLRPESLQATNPGGQAVAEQTPEHKAASARRQRMRDQEDYVRRVQHVKKLGIARIVAERLYFDPNRIANLPRSSSEDNATAGGSRMWSGTADPNIGTTKKKLEPSSDDGWGQGGLGGFAK
jgi:hypothetical protein